MRLKRWLHEWDTFLLILVTGILAGLITFMAFDANPVACHAAVTHMHAPARSFTWVCAHP